MGMLVVPRLWLHVWLASRLCCTTMIFKGSARRQGLCATQVAAISGGCRSPWSA